MEVGVLLFFCEMEDCFVVLFRELIVEEMLGGVEVYLVVEFVWVFVGVDFE